MWQLSLHGGRGEGTSWTAPTDSPFLPSLGQQPKFLQVFHLKPWAQPETTGLMVAGTMKDPFYLPHHLVLGWLG